MFTIDLNKMVKTEKVMIVIKRSIDIVNMKPPNPPAGGEFVNRFLGQLSNGRQLAEAGGGVEGKKKAG